MRALAAELGQKDRLHSEIQLRIARLNSLMDGRQASMELLTLLRLRRHARGRPRRDGRLSARSSPNICYIIHAAN